MDIAQPTSSDIASLTALAANNINNKTKKQRRPKGAGGSHKNHSSTFKDDDQSHSDSGIVHLPQADGNGQRVSFQTPVTMRRNVSISHPANLDIIKPLPPAQTPPAKNTSRDSSRDGANAAAKSSAWSLHDAPPVFKTGRSQSMTMQHLPRSQNKSRRSRGTSPHLRLDPIAIESSEKLTGAINSNVKVVMADTLMTNSGKERPEEKRKQTPPDLLELSNKYFDKHQSFFFKQNNNRASESADGHRYQRFSSIEERPATTDNKSIANEQLASNLKRHKLTPILNRPSVEESRIKIPTDRKYSHTHGLHLSVNFSRQGWKQSLLPLEDQPKSSLEDLGRKYTYTVDEEQDIKVGASKILSFQKSNEEDKNVLAESISESIVEK